MTRKSTLFCAILFVLILSVSQIDVITAEQELESSEVDAILHSVNLNALRGHVEFFTGLGSRFTGYPGCYIAAQYIYQKFQEYGLIDVQYDNYTLPIPKDYGANITIITNSGQQLKVIQAYPLLPNSIHTCSTPLDGLKGRLIYAGFGSFSEFNGKPVKDSIVLMEFNSYDRWLNAAELGAKAVIFIEPPFTNTLECDKKHLNEVPLNFPRVYIKLEDGEYLKKLLDQGEVFVNLRSFMRYEPTTVSNIIGFVEGTNVPNSVVILSAYYDSTSVVPSIAPGANEATGIAALLEAAKYFASHPPPRTIMFVAFSGHGQSIAGARWFVKHLAYDRKWSRYGIAPEVGETSLRAAWQVDFSVGNDDVCFFIGGSFYRQSMYLMVTGGYEIFFNTLRTKLEEAWRRIYGKVWGYEGSLTVTVTPPRPESFGYDGEALAKILGQGGMPSIYLTTSHVFWWHYMNPTDTFDKILPQFDNLRPQIEAFLVSIEEFTRIMDDLPRRPLSTDVWATWFGLLIGQVVEFDESIGWYKPVPNAMVLARPTDWWSWWRPLMYEMTDENGTFVMVGMTTWAQAAPFPNTVNWVRAYRIDEQGNIEYAPDFGLRGSGVFSCNEVPIPATGILGTHASPRPFVAFKTANIVLFDMTGVRPQAEDWISPTTTSIVSFSVTINDLGTHAPLSRWGFITEGRTVMLHIEPNVAIEALVLYGTRAVIPCAILLNASDQYPHGYGFRATWGETIVLVNTPLIVANDLFQLTRSRADILRKYGMYTGAEEYLHQSEEALEKANIALDNYHYDEFRNSAVYAWGLQLRAYTKIKDSLNEAISTIVLSYLAIIPFAFILERFIFGYVQWFRRLCAIMGIFVIMILFLYFFHPGFTIASNVYVSLLGCTIFVLILPMVVMLLSRFLSTLETIRAERLGKHYMGISRVSATTMSFDMGIRFMKRHRLQAILTVIALVLISASMVALTSVRSTPFVYQLKKYGESYYTGVSFRDIAWSPISREFVEYLQSHFKESFVITRSYAYVASWNPGTMVKGPKGMSSFAIILGLTPEDPIWENEGVLIRGRIFSEDDLFVTILVEDVASLLGVDVGDSIEFESMRLTVVGIVSREVLGSLVEPDTYPVFPRDLRITDTVVFYSPVETLLVPYKLALFIGGTPGSVIIIPKDPKKGIDIASELADWTGTELYVAEDVGKSIPIIAMAAAKAYEMGGFLNVLVPLLIGALIILNMMLGLVMSRTREMAILSSVGLAPSHVVGMFLAEGLTYGFVGGIIGYTLGTGLTKLTMAMMPGYIYFNYASNFVLLTVGVTILTVVLSSIYPLAKVSKLVTPSLARKWELPTRPVGDVWDIPLPFVMHGDEEARGVLAFLKEWFDQHEIEDVDAKFTAREIMLTETEYEGRPTNRLIGTIHLAPFTAGLHTNIAIDIFQEAKGKRWMTAIHLTRLSGEYSMWILSTRMLVDEIRKQFLTWRGLNPEEKHDYSVRYKKQEGNDLRSFKEA